MADIKYIREYEEESEAKLATDGTSLFMMYLSPYRSRFLEYKHKKQCEYKSHKIRNQPTNQQDWCRHSNTFSTNF